MKIKELVQKAHDNAKSKGFWEDWELAKSVKVNAIANGYTGEEPQFNWAINNALGNRLLLIVSELAEAQDALRHNDWDNFKEELADVAIRLFDLCGGLEINLEWEIAKKMEKNKNRPYKHGKSF